MGNQDYGEVLCQAVDEIVRKRLEGVSYDQTILCTIVDDTNRDSGLYIVTNNNAVKFEAFSDNTTYRKNDNVYVQIPGGDWNQQKTIISKKTNKNDEPFIYKRPFESLVDITGNIIGTDPLSSNKIIGPVGLQANGPQEKIVLWTYNLINEPDTDQDLPLNERGDNFAAYTRLGIKCEFKSLITPFYINDIAYNVTTGDYGLRLVITALTANKTLSAPKEKDENGNDIIVNDQPAEYTLYLNCADMNGNPYDFQSYYTQEKVFDISQIGKIQTMSLEFYQNPGSFKSAQGEEGQLVPYKDFLDNLLPPNLFVNDVYISLGYDTSEFNSEMVYVYTLDETTYSRSASPLSNNHKEVQLRWIHQLEDGTFKSITEADENMDYEIRWYKYELGHASADEYSGVYWKNLSLQTVTQGISSYEIQDKDWLVYNTANENTDQKYPKFFTTWLIPDTTLQEEQIKAIIIYNGRPYRSNILVCENEDEVVNKATVDAVQALSITCVDREIVQDDGSIEPVSTYGNYRIYGQNGSLLDSAQSSIIRKWIPYFKSSTGGIDIAPTELVEAESIEWIIPTKNTMIKIDGFDYNNKPETETNLPDGSGVYWYENNNDARLHIKRYGVGVKNNDISKINSQTYKIGSYYSQNYSDNTIQCKIIKDKITYTGVKELTFGIAGTSGTDCTFILDFDNGVTAVTAGSSEAVTVTARLYDYENNEVDISNREIEWNWKVSDGKIIQRAIGINNKIELVSSSTTVNASYNILQATIKQWGDGSLTAYLPIPIRRNIQYAYISGATQVIYDSDGGISGYFANPYIIYDINANEISNITWSISNGISGESRYSPQVTTDARTGNQYLSPLSFYVENACERICILGSNGSTIVWSQPILILQNKYPSAMINKWDGKLQIDQEGGSILAPRMVAGMKHSDNTFSGVVLGNWGETNSDNSLTSGETGLYGFDHGEQSYAFKQDGTAFIGKSGTGRIKFDGNEGVIESENYSTGTVGMSINLAEGTIDAHTFTLTAGTALRNNSIILNTEAEANGYPMSVGENFYVDWYGNIHAINGDFTGTINANDGTVGGWNIDEDRITGGNITLYSNGKIATADGDFIVTTAGRLEANNAIISGTITANDGAIGGWEIDEDRITGGNITLYSNGKIETKDGDFKVTTAGRLEANNAIISGKITADEGTIGGWTIVEKTLKSVSGNVILDAGNGEIRADKIIVYKQSNNSDIGDLGYFMGNNNSNVVGIKSNNYSVVLESNQNIRLSTLTNEKSIDIESAGAVNIKGTSLSLNGITGTVALPQQTYIDDNGELFTISASEIKFTRKVTGLYATLA